MVTPWIDSHCHLQDADDLDAVLTHATSAGVAGFVCIGTTESSSRRAIEIARSASSAHNIWATVGIHPHTASEGTKSIAELLAGLERVSELQRPGAVVAVGECGLDYHYEYSPRDAQRQAFAEQIALAKDHDLTLVIHTREAWDDTLSMLRHEGVPERTVIHCFSGGPDEARACLDLGAYLSFSGIVTFKNADDVRSAAALCPLDRLIVETDAPYLAPVPHRGEANEPAYVALVATAIAQQRGLDEMEFSATTIDNTARAFALAM